MKAKDILRYILLLLGTILLGSLGSGLWEVGIKPGGG